MTKTELGNIDALKAIKEQLENQDKTTKAEASVEELTKEDTGKEE